MKILVTGANGFIGKHLCLALERNKYDVFRFDIDSKDDELITYINDADFIVHLAGVNRPLTNEEFYDGNTNFTKRLVDLIKSSGKNTPIIMSSSIQANLDNDYGKSKKMAEDYLLGSNLPVYIYRLNNVFGKWCKPNYNSACATFCYNIAHDLEVFVRDKNYVVHFNYVDDIVNEFIQIISCGQHIGSKDILSIEPVYDCSLGRLVELLKYFKREVESDRHLPIIHSEFELKLFITFLDYLSEEGYSFNFACDERGSFEELYKSKKHGQISINMSYPGISKGGHYHTYKKEIFYTVIGHCFIEQENINNGDEITNDVSNNNPILVNILPNYSHSITNIGNKNSYTLMWISEIFDENNPDTYRCKK